MKSILMKFIIAIFFCVNVLFTNVYALSPPEQTVDLNEYLNSLKQEANNFKNPNLSQEQYIQAFDNYLKRLIVNNIDLLKTNYKTIIINDLPESIYTNEDIADEIFEINSDVLTFINEKLAKGTKENLLNNYITASQNANYYFKFVMYNSYSNVFGLVDFEEKYPNEYNAFLDMNPILKEIYDGGENDDILLPNTSTDEPYMEIDDPDEGNNTTLPPSPELIKYEKINGKCYKITSKGSKTTKEIVDKKYCQESSSGVVKLPEPTLPFGKYITPKFPIGNIPIRNIGEPTAGYGLTETDNNPKESGITIQYTLNKNASIQNFYDTGIRVSLNNTLTYEQMKNVLYQIATKSYSQFLEDKDKCMALIDGELIIIYNTGKEMKVNDFEKIFAKLKNVEVLALDTKINTVTNISEYIEIGMFNKVYINKKEVKLQNHPIVKVNKSLFEIEEFAKLLGANVKKENNKIVITKGNTAIFYLINTDKINVNGEYLKLPVKTQVYNGKVYGYIQILIDKLGYNVNVDSKNKALIINIKPSYN